jgi:ABC-2 type transport system permease protein
MNDTQLISNGRVEPAGPKVRIWWLVFLRELSDLWIGGRALSLLLMFSVLLGIMAYVLASNSELDLIPPKEMVFLTLQAAVAVGLFIGLIIGADSFSGERERATLEALLVTPTSRRQIVVGKLLAALTSWPAALVLSIPYLFVLSQGDPAFGQALFWGSIIGTLLALCFTGFGMLVSIWSNSNKTSLFISLIFYLLCLLPTQFPGTAQTGTMGRLLKRVNPIESANHFLEKVVVNNRTLDEFGDWLVAPVLFAVVVLGLLLFYAGPALRLEAARAPLIRPLRGRGAGLLLIACLMGSLALVPTLHAASSQELEQLLEISIDLEHAVTKNGDPVLFNTVVTNTGTEESSPAVVAMNIINLGEGDPVDPEDWSPERMQLIEALAPGQSVNHSWRVNTILQGDYMVYMVVVPEPDGPEATSQPVASAGIHLTVNPFTRLNPGGVIPVVLTMPGVVVLAMGLVFLVRRQGVDTGRSK